MSIDGTPATDDFSLGHVDFTLLFGNVPAQGPVVGRILSFTGSGVSFAYGVGEVCRVGIILTGLQPEERTY